MQQTIEQPGATSRELVSQGMSSLVALALMGHTAPPNVQRILKQVMDSMEELILFAGYTLDEGETCLARIEARVEAGQREFAILRAQESDRHAGEVLRTMFQSRLHTSEIS